MYRTTCLASAVVLSLCACATRADAQLRPPAPVQQAVFDAAMVVADRGQQLEIYPALRATAQASADGVVRHTVTKDAAGSPLRSGVFGVVYNHTLNTQAYLTGEITFKIKGGGPATGFDEKSWPGFRKVTNPGIYEVVAATPQEIPVLQQRLLARPDLEWVEVVVHYGLSANSAVALMR